MVYAKYYNDEHFKKLLPLSQSRGFLLKAWNRTISQKY